MEIESQPKGKANPVMRLILRVPPLLYRFGLGGLLGQRGFVLLFTEGNRSKRTRVCALNYIKVGQTVYVAAGWGPRTGWYRNLVAKPQANIWLGREHLEVEARELRPGDEMARAHALLKKLDGGPPKPLRPLLRMLGFDYEAERDRSFAHPESLAWMALDIR